MTKKRRLKKTDKQTKLIQSIYDNIGKKKPLTMYQMMIDAGYSATSAHAQHSILECIRDELKPLLIALLNLREKAILRMEKTGNYIGYKNALDGFDKLTKNIQLLSGRPTERTANSIDDETKEALDKMINALK